MEFRVTILGKNKVHVIDEVFDTDDEKFKLSGGIVAILPNKPFQCEGMIIEPEPNREKPSFQNLTLKQKKEILDSVHNGKYRVTSKGDHIQRG